MKRLLEVNGKPIRTAALILTLAVVAGCGEGTNMAFFQPNDRTAETGSHPGQTTKLVERDVEAPDVFQVTEAGLWDGRPRFSGVWVAHPDVSDPHRVIIRNSANGKFVIGALWQRKREMPGPRIEVSSEAAAALGMLAGAPVELNVTALIRETVQDEAAVAAVLADTSGEITETPIDPIAGAAAAIAGAEAIPAVIEQPAIEQTVAAPKPSSLAKPYIQIGIFNVKSNAERSASQMRTAGMVPTVLEHLSNGEPFWRVIIGPATRKSERSALLKQIKTAGFSDAYFVTN